MAAEICIVDSQGHYRHDAPIQVQAAGLLKGPYLLAGAYPDGLVLLERDLQSEMQSCKMQKAREERQHEGTLVASKTGLRI